MPRPLKRTVRSRMRALIVPACCVLLTGYFAWHVFNGDNGIIAWQRLEKHAVERQSNLDRLKAERLALEKKVQLLRPESIDPDLLDERVRASLNYAGPDDIVLFPSENR